MKQILIILGIIFLGTGCSPDDEVSTESETTSPKVSSFGHYQGYSSQLYIEFVRESNYVPVKDGTRLAVDIYYPAKNGAKVKRRHPVILIATRYWRASVTPDGGLLTPFDKDSSERFLLEHGYVVIKYDVRGTGASFGYVVDQGSILQGQDTAYII